MTREQRIAHVGFTWVFYLGRMYRVVKSYKGGYLAACPSSSRSGRGKTAMSAVEVAARRYKSNCSRWDEPTPFDEYLTTKDKAA